MRKQMISRPWGGYTILKKNKIFCVKKLFIANARTSLQSHQYRNEIWFILTGKLLLQIGRQQIKASKGDVFVIPKGRKHRITAINKACILEFAYGSKILEKDITRYEDDYGRASVKRRTPKKN